MDLSNIVMIETVGICNGSCEYCPQGKMMLPPESNHLLEYKTLINALRMAKLGKSRAIYLHHRGEPLLHPDIDKIITTVRNYGFLAYLSTNFILYKPRLFEKILKAGINKIDIHLSAGMVYKEYSDIIKEVLEAYELNRKIRNNGCWIEVNYAMKIEDNQDMVFKKYPGLREINKVNKVRCYYPHDWKSLAYKKKLGVNYKKCDWYKYNCCAVLCTGEIVVCCLDQFKYSLGGNINKIDNVTMDLLKNREICQGCLQQGSMEFIKELALNIPTYFQERLKKDKINNIYSRGRS